MPSYELLLFRTVSAPGKVLVAGGYLVLDRPNVGVVLAATARFFTSVKWTEEEVRVLYCTSGVVVLLDSAGWIRTKSPETDDVA